MTLSRTILPLFLVAVLGLSAHAQESEFNLVLSINTESAERTVELYQGLSGRPQTIAELPGSRIALATTALLAGRPLDQQVLARALEAAKYNQDLGDDVFKMKDARANAGAIKELLEEMKKRNFAQKVVSTVEQLFPSDTRISGMFPIYVVAFGHQNIDAFVRRAVWNGATPVFVGENQGTLTIVVNLAKAVSYGRDVDERFYGLMSVVAHEVFHAAFGLYRDRSPQWLQFAATHRTWFDQLLDLTQNEGIAYYLSLIQRTRGRLEENQLRNFNAAFDEFNRRCGELLSRGITPERAQQIIEQSNTSGYWGSYGSMTGMIIARQIDQMLGRQALSETIALGPYNFFGKYAELMKNRDDIPRLSGQILQYVGSGR
jgi:hypothetical protein